MDWTVLYVRAICTPAHARKGYGGARSTHIDDHDGHRPRCDSVGRFVNKVASSALYQNELSHDGWRVGERLATKHWDGDNDLRGECANGARRIVQLARHVVCARAARTKPQLGLLTGLSILGRSCASSGKRSAAACCRGLLGWLHAEPTRTEAGAGALQLCCIYAGCCAVGRAVIRSLRPVTGPVAAAQARLPRLARGDWRLQKPPLVRESWNDACTSSRNRECTRDAVVRMPRGVAQTRERVCGRACILHACASAV